MGLSQIVAGVSAFMTAFLPSCHHKAPSSPASPPPAATADATTATATTTNADGSTTNSASVNSADHDFGEVLLTNHYERCIQLGGGKECIFLPRLLDNKNAELTVTYESRTPTGQVHDMIVGEADAKIGQPTEVTLGDFAIIIKPDISTK